MFCAAELVAGGGLSWLGLVCGAEALKKLPRKPSGAEARRREAPEGRSGARLPREFFKCRSDSKAAQETTNRRQTQAEPQQKTKNPKLSRFSQDPGPFCRIWTVPNSSHATTKGKS